VSIGPQRVEKASEKALEKKALEKALEKETRPLLDTFQTSFRRVLQLVRK